MATRTAPVITAPIFLPTPVVSPLPALTQAPTATLTQPPGQWAPAPTATLTQPSYSSWLAETQRMRDVIDKPQGQVEAIGKASDICAAHGGKWDEAQRRCLDIPPRPDPMVQEPMTGWTPTKIALAVGAVALGGIILYMFTRKAA